MIYVCRFRQWRSEFGYRLPVKKFCIDDRFDQLIALGIVTNVVLMTMQSFKQSAWQTHVSVVQNFFFTFLFGCEVCGKMFALHPKTYLRSGWYQFDYLITLVSFIGISIEESGAVFNFDPTILRILRIFRIIRIIKAAKIFRHAKHLFGTLEAMANAAPIAGSLLLLFLSLILIFGVTGVVLFGHMCVQGDELLPGAKGVRCLLVEPELRMGRYANFQHVAAAALALFRVATSDSWSQLMRQASLNAAEFPRAPDALAQATAQLSALPNATDTLTFEDALMRDDIARQVRQQLGGCLTTEELEHLRARRLVDCSYSWQQDFERECQSTCGQDTAALFFTLYLCISNLLLINLLLAVLMKQLTITNLDPTKISFIHTPFGVLPKHTFVSAVEVWRSNARRRHRFRKMLERTNKVLITHHVDGQGQVLSLRAGQVCTMLGYWEQHSHVQVRTMDGVEGLAPAMYVKPYQSVAIVAQQPSDALQHVSDPQHRAMLQQHSTLPRRKTGLLPGKPGRNGGNDAEDEEQNTRHGVLRSLKDTKITPDPRLRALRGLTDTNISQRHTLEGDSLAHSYAASRLPSVHEVGGDGGRRGEAGVAWSMDIETGGRKSGWEEDGTTHACFPDSEETGQVEEEAIQRLAYQDRQNDDAVGQEIENTSASENDAKGCDGEHASEALREASEEGDAGTSGQGGRREPQRPQEQGPLGAERWPEQKRIIAAVKGGVAGGWRLPSFRGSVGLPLNAATSKDRKKTQLEEKETEAGRLAARYTPPVTRAQACRTYVLTTDIPVRIHPGTGTSQLGRNKRRRASSCCHSCTAHGGATTVAAARGHIHITAGRRCSG